ncbi:MAG: site-specific DNA-methyltransferase [Opitutales bacterium]|nr:site-specific DNA-methyltransferase [Opitutales bacterium]
MNKKDILDKIKSLDGLSNEERAYLINLVNTKKKYGLVWEDKPEQVEEDLRTRLPVLKEVKERAIINDTESEKHPNHIIIEGDNLHALTALSFTHEGKIDVIYIDPPYNTGNKDFIYNDNYVDKDDSYRHSKWLSFMNRRLKVANKLLSDSGVIFISIDDNEQAQLKLLCDDIFGENKLVGIVTVAKGTTTGQDAKSFGSSCDYLLVYANNQFKLGKFEMSEKDVKRFSRSDEKGAYSILQWRKTGNNDRREDRPNLYYGVVSPNGQEVYPIGPTGYESRWRGSKKSFLEYEKDNMVEWVVSSGEWKPYLKYYLEGRGKAPSNLWIDIEGNKKATIELKEIFKNNLFNNPKPTDLIDKCLQIAINKDSLILDFFAGSGTTMHAVIKRNLTDSGSRKVILVTNNENNIAEEITYERNKRVIRGYKNSKGQKVEGLKNNNLRYYQCDFVERTPTLNNKRELTQLATELLCIKEDCYHPVSHHLSFSDKEAQIYTNGKGKYLVAIYYSRNQIAVQEQLIEWVQAVTDATEKIRLYGFSPEKETLAEEFAAVEDKIEAVALPEAIYNAYLATFKTIKVDKKDYALTKASATETGPNN